MAIHYTKQPFTANGGADGTILVSTTLGFVPGAVIFLASNTITTPVRLLVDEVISGTKLGVKLYNVYNRYDCSAFLLADGATITQPDQPGGPVYETLDAKTLYVQNNLSDDYAVSIARDLSNNLTFTDPANGTKTLTELAAGGGGGGAVDSVFGRVGVVVAQAGDYTAAQVGADPTGTAAAAIVTHVGLADPHTQYQRESEKGVASGYASLDGAALVPSAQIPVITDAQHGSRSGGTLHADVVAAGASGFMTGADKTKLDGLPTSAVASTRLISTTAPLTGGGDLSADRTLAISAATTLAAGSMSAADKTKLNNLLEVKDETISLGTGLLKLNFTGAGVSASIDGGDPSQVNISVAGGGGGSGAKGTATVDFGAAPGTNVVTVVVSGQAGISLTSQVQAVIMGIDSTTDHNAVEHSIVPITVRPISLTAGTGFTLQAASEWRLTGQFKVRWSWGD